VIPLNKALVDDEVAPTVLATVLLQDMDKDWMLLEPLVLWEELAERAGVLLSRAQKDKIMAIRVSIKTNQALTQWPVFLNVAKAFNGLQINPHTTNLVTPEMIAWTLSELQDIGGDPLQPDNVELNDSVSSIICAIMFDNGLIYAPEDPIGKMIKNDLADYQERYNPESKQFAVAAKEAYQNTLNDLPVEPGSPEAIHTMRLLLIDAYVQKKREEKERDLNDQ